MAFSLRSVTSGVLKIGFVLLFFGLLSLVIEISFFNKDVFYSHDDSPLEAPSLDYFWLRHLVVFLILAVSFFGRRRRIGLKNLKPYAGFFLLALNMVPGLSFLSKYLFLFLSFLLVLFLKSDFRFWSYRNLLRKNLSFIVFFLVIFVLFFPLLFKEGYLYDPLGLYTQWPGYRLSRASDINMTTGGASDLFDAFLPQWTYSYTEMRKGTFPLWRYDKGLGVAPYATSFIPEELISFLVRPDEALTLRVLLRLFLSMTGMFLLLRAMSTKDIVAVIGGIAYALSGFIIGWLHGPQSSTAFHIPFLFLFLVKYLRSKEPKFLLYFAVMSGLTIYSGFIAVAGYALYAAGLFLLLYVAFMRQSFVQKLKDLFRVSVYWLLGILLVGFHFLDMAYTFYVRQSVDMSYRSVGRVISLPLEYFKNILFPFAHGWRMSPEVRPYVSSIILLFFLFGVVYVVLYLVRNPRRFLERETSYVSFFLMGIPFLMAMFGLSPFYQISAKLPILNSSPLLRLQSITGFVLVILGAKGLDFFVRSFGKIYVFFKRRTVLFIVLIESLFFCSVFLAVRTYPTEQDLEMSTLYPVFIFLSGSLLAFQLTVFFKRKAGVFLIFLLALLSAEAVVQNRRYLPVNKNFQFITRLDVPLINFVKNHSRKYDGVLVFDSNYNINGTLGNYGIRERIVHEFHSRDYRDLIVDTFSERSFKSPTATALDSGSADFTSSFIQLLGVKYLIFRSEFDGKNLPPYYRRVYSQLDGQVFQNLIYEDTEGIFFGRPKSFAPEERGEVLKAIKSMDYAKYVYVEEEELDLDCREDMVCDVRVLRYTPNRIVYRYRANSDGILTFPEAYDKDWTATVNTTKVKVLNTNLLFRGIAVPKGKGVIVFEYHISKTFRMLILLALLCLSLLFVLYSFSSRRKNPVRG